MKQRVSWHEIEEAAKTMFSVWVEQPELQWGKKAWKILEEAGLSGYADELERHSVLFRFMALGGIYRDFCCMAWEECTEKEYCEWAEYLDLDSFITCQAYVKIPGWDPDDDLDQNDALHYLVEDRRSEVVSALLNGFGGVSELYASLWKSRQFIDCSEDFDGQEPELIIPGMMEGSDPFSPMTIARLNAYGWVDEGCCEISNW